MKLKKVFNTMFYILTFTSVSGQNIEFIKANFKDNLKEFKLANYKIQEGDALFQQRKYEEALNSYFVANDFNSNSATLNAKIGAVYLKTATKHLAHSYLQNAVSLNSKIDSYYRFLLGRSYHFGNEFDEAIKNYEMAKHTPSKIKSLSTNEIKKRIEECKNGKKLINGTVEVKIDLVSTEINTVNQEYVPLINADETVMFFTSRRQENLGGEKDFLIND